MKANPIVSSVLGFLPGTVFGHYASLGLAGFDSWVSDEIGRASPYKIDLQAKNGCLGGNIAEIRRNFTDQSLWLERGADGLFICSDEAIETTVVEAPRALAREFPACLQYITGSLRMLRASEAICELPAGRGYVGDGALAAETQDTAALGAQSSAVKPCSAETLAKFGFAAEP